MERVVLVRGKVGEIGSVDIRGKIRGKIKIAVEWWKWRGRVKPLQLHARLTLVVHPLPRCCSFITSVDCLARDRRPTSLRVRQPCPITPYSTPAPPLNVVCVPLMLPTKVITLSFTMTFLAEWGDRSQIATIAMAASKDPYGVTVGGILGHSLCTGMAVIGGRMLATR